MNGILTFSNNSFSLQNINLKDQQLHYFFYNINYRSILPYPIHYVQLIHLIVIKEQKRLMIQSSALIKNTVVDQCFRPLLQEYYERSYKEEDFILLSEQLMDPSSVKKHQALIGLYYLLKANITLLPKMVSSGLLFKVVFYLKEQQFPQLCFQALRILFLTIHYAKVAEYLANTGGVNSLLNLINEENNKILVGVSLWILNRIAHKVGGFQLILPKIDINDFIASAGDPDKEIQVNSTIADLLINFWTHQLFLRPEDIDRFRKMLLEQVINVNISGDQIQKCFKLLKTDIKNISFTLAKNNWKLVGDIVPNLEGKENYVLREYMKFLLKILKENEGVIALVEKLVSLDVFKVFENLLNDEQEVQINFCILVQSTLSSRSQLGLKYFLSRTSILIKLYYLIEGGSTKIKVNICYIFSLLTNYDSEDVLLLFEEAKIVAVYHRLLKEQTEAQLIEMCLYSLLKVLTYANKKSLTTFNWFINFLKTDKIQDTLTKVEQLHIQPKFKAFLTSLSKFFAEPQVQQEAAISVEA